MKAFISIFAIFFSAIVISILTALYILLVKQIEIMNTDASSFQALYMADSVFECALYKEQQASTTDESVFLPANSGGLGDCVSTGDTAWVSQPAITAGRAQSTFNVSLETINGPFCGSVTVNKETRVTAYFTSAPAPDTITISGQSRDCSDTSSKVVERLVEFYY